MKELPKDNLDFKLKHIWKLSKTFRGWIDAHHYFDFPPLENTFLFFHWLINGDDLIDPNNPDPVLKTYWVLNWGFDWIVKIFYFLKLSICILADWCQDDIDHQSFVSVATIDYDEAWLEYAVSPGLGNWVYFCEWRGL